MNGFFKKLMLKKHLLSELEEKIFEIMIDNQDDILKFNLTVFSEKYFVSTATVSRACKKLGYNGYSEFQYAYKLFRENKTVSIDTYTGTNEYINKVIQDMKDNIQSFNEEIINEMVKYLVNSQQVEIFGVGRTLSVCREAATKLTFAGKISSTRGDWDERRAVARYLRENDLAILISISGETEEIIECAKTLRENNVNVIGIVGTKDSSLLNYVNLSLVMDITPAYINKVDMSSHFLFSILFDTLAITYMEEKLGESHF